MKKKLLFKSFLNFFWLRPENALIFSLKAEKLSQYKKFFKGNSVDISCGNGIFTFITFGGELSQKSDMYQSLDYKNKDIYDSFKKYNLIIKKYPKKKFLFGTDWKLNLLNKSKKLKFYNNLILHDNNKRLPFQNDYFDFMYNSSSYWVKKFNFHIAEMIRVLKPGGKLLLTVKTKNIIKFNLRSIITKNFDDKFYKIIDGNRINSYKGLKNLEEYLNIIKKIKKAKIVRLEPIYCRKVNLIWDVGLRPIIKPLSILANSAKIKDRTKAKSIMISIFLKLFDSFIKNYKPQKKFAVEWLVEINKVT
ncbi:methyltransferase domain-containing protein [Candidatus Pelagibacter communis]|uniref:methyltransferase domain-containing protein n=1 Tax=Pelagibacter ubique TaxID=198252 RepID=UPI00094C0D62|nr:methyltransferase domain-containing protein [Candidatus Pelagibacter ubique]